MVKAVVGRIENELAVLLVGFYEFKTDLPVGYLPEGVKEGDIIEMSFSILEEETGRQNDKVVRLIDKLKNKGK